MMNLWKMNVLIIVVVVAMQSLTVLKPPGASSPQSWSTHRVSTPATPVLTSCHQDRAQKLGEREHHSLHCN